jgi:hypothetical protein
MSWETYAYVGQLLYPGRVEGWIDMAKAKKLYQDRICKDLLVSGLFQRTLFYTACATLVLSSALSSVSNDSSQFWDCLAIAAAGALPAQFTLLYFLAADVADFVKKHLPESAT